MASAYVRNGPGRMMLLPEPQLRLTCPGCAARTVLDARFLAGGSFRCTACQQMSDVDLDVLRRCAAGLYCIIAKLSERSQE